MTEKIYLKNIFNSNSSIKITDLNIKSTKQKQISIKKENKIKFLSSKIKPKI